MKARCPECGSEFEVVPEIGKIVECPNCTLKLRIVAVNVNKIYFETVDEEEMEEDEF